MPPTIRLATESDADQIQAIYAPIVRDTPISFESEPPSLDEMRQRIVETLAYLPWLVCDNDGAILGYVYATKHRERTAYQWSVDVSVYIRSAARRLGIGRALYTSLFAGLIVQGFYNAYAGATLPNPASVGLHESLGFQRIGIYQAVGYKAGAWHDVVWWTRPLQPRPAVPQPPTPLPRVWETTAWQMAVAAGAPYLRHNGH